VAEAQWGARRSGVKRAMRALGGELRFGAIAEIKNFAAKLEG
jgi:hypothetical protein